MWPSSAAVLAFKRGGSEAVEILLSANQVWLTPIVVGELLAGFAAGSKEAWNRDELLRFLSTSLRRNDFRSATAVMRARNLVHGSTGT